VKPVRDTVTGPALVWKSRMSNGFSVSTPAKPASRSTA